MREKEVSVAFQPCAKPGEAGRPASGATAYVLPGTRLAEAAAVAAIGLDQPCGGEGVCGKCRVRVVQGAAPPTPAEAKALAPAELADGWRLACQSAVSGPTLVEVPAASLLATYHKILAHTAQVGVEVLDPAVRKQYVELPPPSRADDAPDMVRLQRVLGPLEVGLDLLRDLPRRLRDLDFRGTAVAADGRLIDFEPGDTCRQSLAVAVDVGTTTLAAALLDLNTGRALDVVSQLNPQTRFGDDVLARILLCQQRPDGLEQLHRAVIEAVREMIGQLARRAGADRRQIYEVTFSGNTTMQQLLCGVDPAPLGEVPFVPGGGNSLCLHAAALGLDLPPRGRAVVMPVIGGFVGGDTLSGILATALAESPGPTLLVDIGTNGEIVLAGQGKLSAASTAAGPAFEGARITHGVRGSTGAIEKVIVDGRLRLNVIGDVPPRGLCGSGLVDLAAELLRLGIVSCEGRMSARGQLPPSVPQDLAERVIEHEGRPAFLVAAQDETGTGRPILLTQRDVRELQLATGAIRAGITILLKRAGLRPADLEAVLVAGGFGNFIRRSNAQRIGLLPHEVPRHRIRYQGNTSLAGAQLVALSRQARRLADELARHTEHVDLSRDPDFARTFAESMLFPDGEGQ